MFKNYKPSKAYTPRKTIKVPRTKTVKERLGIMLHKTPVYVERPKAEPVDTYAANRRILEAQKLKEEVAHRRAKAKADYYGTA